MKENLNINEEIKFNTDKNISDIINNEENNSNNNLSNINSIKVSESNNNENKMDLLIFLEKMIFLISKVIKKIIMIL